MPTFLKQVPWKSPVKPVMVLNYGGIQTLLFMKYGVRFLESVPNKIKDLVSVQLKGSGMRRKTRKTGFLAVLPLIRLLRSVFNDLSTSGHLLLRIG